MSPQLKEIPSNEKLPTDADVVVNGGGIIGAAATYFMSKQGYNVALVEKGQVGCEQSSRNWGWCRQQNRDERELPTSVLSMRLWDEMSKDIGFDLGFRRCGLRYATDDPQQLAQWDAWQDLAKQYGVKTVMLSAKEANTMIPARGRDWIGGVHSIHDGKGEPAIAAPMIAEGARNLGATIHQNCAARGLDITNGKVEGVITEHGTIKTNKVLCAAGAWASAFCRHHGISFPQSSVRQTAFRTKPMENIGEAIYTNGGIALTRRLDGSYTVAISGSQPARGSPPHTWRPTECRLLRARHDRENPVARPGHSNYPAIASWSGISLSVQLRKDRFVQRAAITSEYDPASPHNTTYPPHSLFG